MNQSPPKIITFNFCIYLSARARVECSPRCGQLIWLKASQLYRVYDVHDDTLSLHCARQRTNTYNTATLGQSAKARRENDERRSYKLLRRSSVAPQFFISSTYPCPPNQVICTGKLHKPYLSNVFNDFALIGASF